MFNVVLFQPEIPPNTGNVIRLCANSGCRLHLIGPLGFSLEDRLLRRAGLDYHELAVVETHAGWAEFLATAAPRRIFAFSTRADRTLAGQGFEADDTFVFGPETRGLPVALRTHAAVTAELRIPMLAGNRSLNLSNAVAVVVYEAWRQQGYAGGA